MIWAHSPEGRSATPHAREAALPALGRTDLVVALFDNRKANAAALLEGVGQELASRLAARLVRHSKPNASHPAEPELLARIAKEADLVVLASSD